MLDVGRLKSGEHILVRGAGGVGLTAVQIAKANGAHVTALASGKILDSVRSAGADEVYDYRKTAIGKVVPVIDSVYPLGQIADAHRRAEERGMYADQRLVADGNAIGRTNEPGCFCRAFIRFDMIHFFSNLLHIFRCR